MVGADAFVRLLPPQLANTIESTSESEAQSRVAGPWEDIHTPGASGFR